MHGTTANSNTSYLVWHCWYKAAVDPPEIDDWNLSLIAYNFARNVGQGKTWPLMIVRIGMLMDYHGSAVGIFSSRFTDLVMKTAVFYLILPMVLFLGSWFNPTVAVVGLALLVYLMLPLFKRGDESVRAGSNLSGQVSVLLFAAIAAIYFAVLSAPTLASIPLIDATKHGTILADLSRERWPVAYLMSDSGPTVLRYSFAYYLVPAALTKLLGMEWINHAELVWTALGIFLFLLMAASKCKSVVFAFFSVLVAIFFSGLAPLYIIATGEANSGLWSGVFDAWAREMGNGLLIGSHPFELRWSPQHALPSWLAAGILFHSLNAVWFRRTVVLIGACLMLWSPFTAIAFVLVVLAADAFGSEALLAWRHLITKRNILAVALSLPIILFLTASSAAIPTHLFYIPRQASFFIAQYVFFILLEFVILLVAIRFTVGRFSAVLSAATLVLLALPFTFVGASNDLQMRASQLPFTIVMFAALAALGSSKHFRAKLTLVAMLMIGAAGGLAELLRPSFNTNVSREAYTVPMFAADFAGSDEYVKPQYLAQLSANSFLLKLMNFQGAGYRPKLVMDMSTSKLTEFGSARFNPSHGRVESDIDTDAALVTPPVALSAGLYQVEMTLSWNVTAAAGSARAAHVSIHGKKVLMSIPTSVMTNKTVTLWMYGDGAPWQLSFGLGGWGSGKGFVEMEKLRIYRIDSAERPVPISAAARSH